MQEINVPICMITYNHAKFIRQAIEGVLMQKTNFPIKLIIGEDCSTDETRSICIEYKEKYPDLIELRLPNNNLGAIRNLKENIDLCMQYGKYIAMCEGDDYWVDPLKLQKQIDYLEANSNCGLVFTDVKLYDDKKQIFLESKVGTKFYKNEMVIPELIKSKYIEFASIVVRSDLLFKIMNIISPFLENKVIADTRLILEFAKHSNIGYIPEITTVYRLVDGSASHPKTTKKMIETLLDTYNCRKEFIQRYNLNKKMLGIPVCNFNKALINHANVQPNYLKALAILLNIKLLEMLKYSSFGVLKIKMSYKVCLKLFFSFIGVSSVRIIFKRNLKLNGF